MDMDSRCKSPQANGKRESLRAGIKAGVICECAPLARVWYCHALKSRVQGGLAGIISLMEAGFSYFMKCLVLLTARHAKSAALFKAAFLLDFEINTAKAH